ncbi:sugar phosphate nucleotidyltransferase [Brevibacillus laterosporus]|uniref:sugar phosphate nucleotidyltransferase n=1 Tax=Brevibacillus laterosporus TaxID=1465 RepID=UPI0003B1DAAE|nr:sugar phosphate nucleotidyltransferase [Brevibacillus laterosporus]ERM19218.1 spore coat protein [Brevibacillus laterosporus PE36]
MKGIILAGGTGSRLYPLTKVTNKHLLPIGKYPMIYHPIHKLKQADIHEVLIVTSREHMGDVVNLLGSGVDFNMQFTYKVQDEPKGIAQALGMAEDFAHRELITVILGDNVFSDNISNYVKRFKERGYGANILIKQVIDPERYGVPKLDDGKIVSITEKPSHPDSQFAVTGIYMYDWKVFDIIKTLQPSARGELEITDVNNAYIERNEMTYDVLQGWWTDAGTHHSILHANQLAATLELDKLEGE